MVSTSMDGFMDSARHLMFLLVLGRHGFRPALCKCGRRLRRLRKVPARKSGQSQGGGSGRPARVSSLEELTK